MIRRPPVSTRTDTLFPYTTLFRSTTDTAAALRGAEIGAEIVLKATKVDGIYSADPNKDPNATRYSRISFDEAIVRRLEVMDATAFALCRDQKLPLKVFSLNKPCALKRAESGEDDGKIGRASCRASVCRCL